MLEGSTVNGLKVLVVGGGGREHTLVWKIAQSARVAKIYCAPGNAGIALIAECVPLAADDLTGIVNFCQERQIDLVVVGPELPLTMGLVDRLEEAGIKAFGPQQKAAALEGSKGFAKDLMARYGIPTARYGVFTEYEAARSFARELPGPWVVKADGLAAGKGVMICSTIEETDAEIRKVLLEKVFGAAGDKVLIEEFLDGEELSLMAFCDGKTVVPLVSAQDHKRVFSGDQGPNTGGMGAYSPAPVATPALCQEILDTVLEPTMRAMALEGCPFKGVLYAGLMITKDGPRVLEFNARFGDPETQVILPRLKTDLVEIMLAICEERLDRMMIEWSDEACVTVVMASAGYPGHYEKGFPISGLENVPPEVLVFHSGTAVRDQQIITAGGRVLAVTALGNSLQQAVNLTYSGVKRIYFEGAHFRDDIAHRAFHR
jgi:phosphoribosylamine--glycine ligase